MSTHPKTLRRYLLQALYACYQADPFDMLGPEHFLADGRVPREDLPANMYYLHDRGLAEVMRGYQPPMFAAARITADGIDLVENHFEFNLRFPPAPGEEEETAAGVPTLVERLVEEADFAAIDGERRQSLFRDVQYLRDELARPAERWRVEVVWSVLTWLEGYREPPEVDLPALAALRAQLEAFFEGAG